MTIIPPLASSLENRLQAFEDSKHPGVWQHLDKQQLLRDLRSRLSDPYQLQQGAQPLCGPASVVFELIRKQPDRYIDICQSLYETGRFGGYTQTIVAAPKLYRSYGNLRMAQLDWMLLATLKNAANLILPLHPRHPQLIRNLAGMTKTWEMCGWTRELLGYTRTHTQHTAIGGEVRALQMADAVLQNGGVAFALINSEGLLGNASFLAARFYRLYPSHWVTLLGNIAIAPTRSHRVEFEIYSWGRKIHLKTQISDLKKYLWGISIGKH
jgi:hypothetical protein